MNPIDFQENRELYGAKSDGVPMDLHKCEHKLTRISHTEVECSICRSGWRFNPIPDEILALIK